MLDLLKFLRATNPTRTLAIENEDDRKYYIDFSSVRGENIIEKLRDNIAIFSPDIPTCDLFTGHIGCGKSTELLRLKDELQQQGYHVVYFESDEDLEMNDVDVNEILLVIARRISESLENEGFFLDEKTGYFQRLFKDLQEMIQGVDISCVGFTLGICEITAQAKESPRLRDKLRGYLEPRTSSTIDAINRELIQPAIQKLQQQGKKGLVVIVDNLDRLSPSPKPWGRPQPEYLFVDRGTSLRGLGCHVIYTIPLGLRFSNDYRMVVERFTVSPLVLPMVPVHLRDGHEHEQGMVLLRQLILARAFPDFTNQQRFESISEICDSPETLDRLCQVSGGHVRNLLRFLNSWIREERKLPLSRERLEKVIQIERNQLVLGINQGEWELLRNVAQQKKLTVVDDDQNPRYQKLLRNLLLLEYCDQDGSWFDINPILADAKEFKV